MGPFCNSLFWLGLWGVCCKNRLVVFKREAAGEEKGGNKRGEKMAQEKLPLKWHLKIIKGH